MNVYLDYAATAPLEEEILDQMLPLLQEDFGNPDSVHSYGRRAAYCVTQARDLVAKVLGVKPAEVYFTSGGTEADNWAVRNLGHGMATVSAIEHAAVMSAAPLREDGYAHLPVGTDGIATLGSLNGAGIVCLMAVNNETGSIQPIAEAAKRCHAEGALLFSDCVQAAATLDLKEVLAHADAIALSAHKLGGPKGVGALVVKKGVPLKPLLAGGEQERGLRGGTLNVAGIVGFAHALKRAQAEREAFCRHTGALRDLFEDTLRTALGDMMRVDGENRAPNLSHITFEGGGDAFLNLLDLNGVACSGGAACSAKSSKPSHVLLAMGRSEDEAKRGVRFSFGRRTTEEEVLYAAKTVIRLLSEQ